MQIVVEELSIDFEAWLGTLQRGESVILMYHGQPQAQVVPLSTTSQPVTGARDLRQSPLFGLWKDREDCADVPQFMENLRRSRFSC
jgi:antitoxin (DNA-binding transcriptional repressor) of toxin-antitoxin stability system